MRLKYNGIYCFFFLVIINLVFFTKIAIASEELVAKNGIIDLKNFDFNKNVLVNLYGEWEYYPNKLLTPEELENYKGGKKFTQFPSLWDSKGIFNPSFGVATYRLKVKLNKNVPLMGINMPDVYTSSKLWINNKLISENGKVSDKKNNFIPHWEPKINPFFHKEENTIVIQIANFSHHKGGAHKPVKLGAWESIFKQYETENTLSIFLTGLIIMSFLFFIGLYYFGNKEKYVLYFAVFSIFYSYRVIGTENYYLHKILIPNLWYLLVRIEYITLFLSSYMIVKFLDNIYPEDISPKINNLIKILCLTLSFSVVLPTYVFTAFINYFIMFVFIANIYIITTYIKAYKNNREGASFAIISVGFLIITVFINSIAYFGFIPRQYFLEFIGYSLFFFFQSLILSYKFARTFKKAMIQAESGIKARSLFLATVSHELRTPMNGVIGMTDMLGSTKLEKDQEEYVKTIRESGETLLRLINDILDYSKFESGNISLENQEFNLDELCDEILRILLPSIIRSNNKIYFIISPVVPNILCSDASRIRQILINLINNANKFTQNGVIEISIDLETLEDKKIKLLFKIKDTGIGIKKEKIDNLFKPFSQAHENKFGGTGLGLIICKILVNAMDGDIWLESEEGKGTCFSFDIKLKAVLTEENIQKNILVQIQLNDDKLRKSIKNYLSRNEIRYNYKTIVIEKDYENIIITDESNYISILDKFKDTNIKIICIHNRESKLDYNNRIIFLPQPITFKDLKSTIIKNKSEVSLIKETIEESLIRDNIKLLLVDDNEINLKVGKYLLEKIGYKPDTASNGLEAYNHFRKNDYDVIFMDVDMPIMNGFESTQKIREYTKNDTSPIIVAMTANAMQGDREKCLESGMNDYIPKPIKIDTIKTILNKWVFSV